MSLTYGFYNSINEDRKYNASQMSKLFDGVLNDGIFMSIGDKFIVTANSGMNISVGSGRAWFNHTWTLNDSILVLPVSESEILLNRIDVVVLEVNNTAAVRANSIKIIEGAGATVPVAPDLVNNSEVHQYPLAHIYVGVGVTEILQANITNYVGTAETPFATGVMQTMSIDALVAQWQSEWDVWSAEQQADYIDWFNNINALLGTEPATNLQIQVSAHDVRLVDLEYDARIAYIAEKIRNRNFIKNGDFSDGATGWLAGNSNISVASNTLTNTGDGTSPWPFNRHIIPTPIVGHKYLMKVKIKVTNSSCSGVTLYAGSEYAVLQQNPVANTWYEAIAILTAVGTNVNVEIYHNYADAPTALNKVMESQYVSMLDLTSIFGADNEPTKEETDAAIDLLGGWTDVPVADKYLTGYNLGANIGSLTNKATPVDADMVAIADSAASNASKKLTWANIKATLKSYFDNLYLSLSGGTITGPLLINAGDFSLEVRHNGNTANTWYGRIGTKNLTSNRSSFLGTYGPAVAGVFAHSSALDQWSHLYINTINSADAGGGAIIGTLGVGTTPTGTAGEIRATNNITAYYSDARLKDFLGKIPNALDKVLALNGYLFVENQLAKDLGYNNERVQVGVSAQEVQAVLPEAVTKAPISDEYLTVWYEKLVPLLIEAIKEQQTQIDELKAKVH